MLNTVLSLESRQLTIKIRIVVQCTQSNVIVTSLECTLHNCIVTNCIHYITCITFPILQVLQMTYMLIGVSICFTVLTTPIGIFAAIWTYEYGFSTLSEILSWEVSLKYLYVVYYANSVINFWVYALAGKKFREELRRILGCSAKSKEGHDSAGRTSAVAKSETTLP